MPDYSVIQRLSEAQGHRCAYCGFPMVVPGLDRDNPRWRADAPATGARRSHRARRATRDHIIPRSAGGPDAWGNMVAACSWCNGYRGNQPAEVAFAKIQRRLRRRSHPHQMFAATGWWPSAAHNGLPTIHVKSAQIEQADFHG